VATISEFKYRAFLSYSHRDMVWAKWLHAALEGFSIDKFLVGNETPIGPVPKTLRPIFRDREDFSGGHTLTDATVAALDTSAALVVLCSTVSATRPTVNEEVRLFRSRHPDRPVIPVIIEGTWPENFPPALRYELAADGTITDRPLTILGPDLSDSGDGKSLGLAKVVAGLTGLHADDIFRRAERARRKRNRFWAGLAGMFLLLAVAATGSAVYAWQQLKTNEIFLDATLGHFTGVVDKAVSLSQNYAVPLSVTLGFLKEAEGMFDVMARYGRPTSKLTHRKAIMLLAFADNYRDLGQIVEAEKRSAEARALMSELVRQDPDNAEWAFELGHAHERNGDVLLAKGNLADALAEYRARQTIIERLVKTNPGNASWQRDLSTSYLKIGDVLVAQSQLDQALNAYLDSLAIMERLTAGARGTGEWQPNLTGSYDRVGNVLMEQGQLDAALKAYRNSLAVRERFAAADPSNSAWQRDLSVSYSKLGEVLGAQGQLDAALKAFRDGLAIAERLVAADRGNTVWQRDLAVSYNKVGEVLGAQGQLDAALKAFRDSLAIFERMVAADRSNLQWQRDLSVSYDKVANVLVAQGEHNAALKVYRNGLAIAERLAASDRSNTEWQHDLALSHDALASVNVELGQVAEALAELRQGRAIMAALVARAPDYPQWQDELAEYDREIARLAGSGQGQAKN
jgi:tetratricopeptide (TPR) repeat protein